MVVEQLRGHLSFPALNIPKFSAATLEDVELAAEKTRIHWGLGIDSPILHVGRVLEHAGVIVVRHLVKSSKVDAFSRQGKTTFIFLNDEIKSASRWNFDIGHECGHLCIHDGIHTGDLETEAQADRFASAFLMPRKAFSREFKSPYISWPHIFDLKRRWNCSAASIVRRAYDLGLIPATQYRRAYQYMSFKEWTKGEPNEPIFQDPELLSTALEALGKKIDLSASELCSALHFKPETFSEITGLKFVPQPPKRADILQMKRT